MYNQPIWKSFPAYVKLRILETFPEAEVEVVFGEKNEVVSNDSFLSGFIAGRLYTDYWDDYVGFDYGWKP
jgi:hypothetical protein